MKENTQTEHVAILDITRQLDRWKAPTHSKDSAELTLFGRVLAFVEMQTEERISDDAATIREIHAYLTRRGVVSNQRGVDLSAYSRVVAALEVAHATIDNMCQKAIEASQILARFEGNENAMRLAHQMAKELHGAVIAVEEGR